MCIFLPIGYVGSLQQQMEHPQKQNNLQEEKYYIQQACFILLLILSKILKRYSKDLLIIYLEHKINVYSFLNKDK